MDKLALSVLESHSLFDNSKSAPPPIIPGPLATVLLSDKVLVFPVESALDPLASPMCETAP